MKALTNPRIPTMSSREIAELVESTHHDVKRSMERLKDRGLITFEPMAEKSTGGRPATSYLVNKRDSYVVVAQLSPEFTARLVDRWQELEAQVTEVAPAQIATDRPTKVFPEYFRIAKLIGLDKNAAALSANQATYKKTGENVLLLMGVTHLETEQPWFTPTELGKRIEVSGRQFNLLLMESGLQQKEGDHWLPTDSAKKFCRFFDTSKRHTDGTVVQQLKWSGDVLSLVSKEAA